jgi:pimeloyl-ACP methyl ester carboxylesterase
VGRLANMGFLVVVVSLEPTRVANKRLGGADPRPLRNIVRQVLFREKDSRTKIDEWILVGHSQGSKRAAELSNKLQQFPEFQNLSKIVLWAAGNRLDFTSMVGNDFLVLQGERDPSLHWGDRDTVVQSLQSSCSPRSREVILPGASHRQFGSYQVSSATGKIKAFAVLDEAAISRELQQDQVGNLTAMFCSLRRVS